MALNYERIGWENAPSTNTPIDAGSLNHMDNGILAVSNQYDVDVPYLQQQVAGIPAMLDSYLADQIEIDVTNWLSEHVTPGGSTIVVDDTLTISGAAADSKTVGDALVSKANTSDVNAALATKADAEDLDEAVGDIGQLKNAITTKAEQDGAYPDLTAGQLLSKNESADSVPYNFRAVGHEATLEYTDAIVGGSVVKNQLVKSLSSDNWSAESGVTATYDNGVVTISSTTNGNGIRHRTAISVHAQHKYFIDMSVCGASGKTVAITGIPASSGIAADHEITAANTWETEPKIVSCGLSGNMTLYALARGGTYENVKMKDICIIDLTAMFGTTIADYIYTLETATEGSGVAWLNKHFPKLLTYQEYNAGEIVSVQGLSQHVTVGFNQWDGIWEDGGISEATGSDETDYTAWRSKNYIWILPNTVYYAQSSSVNKAIRARFYDANKNYIGAMAQDGYVMTGRIFTTPDNAYYMRISPAKSNIPNHDICINLSDPTRNGEYEPYQKRTYPLDSTKTFRGIFKLDASNNLYADGDRYLPDGTVQRRYGVVDLGTLNWTKSGNPQRFEGSAIPNAKAPATTYAIPDIMTDIYMPTYSSDGSSDRVIALNINGEPRIYDSAKYQSMSASEFKTAMNGVMCVYELATPTTDTAEPYTNPQIVDPDGTEEYVSTPIAPVGHESRYPLDIAGRLDKILTMPTVNGTYTLRATVNNGAVTYAWVST